jgi:hypothetical protein
MNASFVAEAEYENAIHSGVNKSHSNATRPIVRSVCVGAKMKGTERRTRCCCAPNVTLCPIVPVSANLLFAIEKCFWSCVGFKTDIAGEPPERFEQMSSFQVIALE